MRHRFLPNPTSVIALSLLGGCLWGCPSGEPDYESVNDADNCIEVQIRPGEASVDSAVIDVSDQNGARTVGTLTVTPGAGPVNTLHVFVLELSEPGFAAEVDRAVLTTDNNFADRTDGGIGLSDFVMQTVPGSDGGFDAELDSGGEEGETRTDTFCVHTQRVIEE